MVAPQRLSDWPVGKQAAALWRGSSVGLSPEAVGGPAAQRWGNDGGSGVPGGTPYSPVPSSPSAGLLYHRQRPDVARDATPPPLPHPRSVPSPKLRAPSGYSSEETVSSDEEEGDWAARRRSAAPDGSRRVLRAPGGADDESSSSDDEEAAAWVWAAAGAGAEIGWSESAGVRRLSHAERELQEWREQQAARAQVRQSPSPHLSRGILLHRCPRRTHS